MYDCGFCRPRVELTLQIDISLVDCYLARSYLGGAVMNRQSWRDARRIWIHVATLLVLGTTLPLLQVLGENPTFFIARFYLGSEVMIFGLVLVLTPLIVSMPILLTGLGSGLFTKSLSWLSLVTGVFVCFLPLQFDFWQAFDVTYETAVGVGVLGAGAFAYAYFRFGWLRQALSYSSCVFIVLPLIFVWQNDELLSAGSSTESAVIANAEGKALSAPVLVLLFDELPLSSLLDDALLVDPVAFPNLSRFAQDATWYQDTLSIADRTSVAVPSLLRGRADPELRYPGLYHPERDSIFSLLPESVNKLNFERHTYLCPREECTPMSTLRSTSMMGRVLDDAIDVATIYAHLVLPPHLMASFDALADIEGDQLRKPTSEAVIDTLIDQLPTLDPNSFVFAHFTLPHHPFYGLPGGATYPGLDGYPDGGSLLMDGAVHFAKPYVWSTEWAAMQALQRHLLQVAYLDWHFGRLYEAIRARPDYDDMTVIVVSDHGIRFHAKQDARRATRDEPASFAEVLGVPLLIKYPQQSGGRIDTRVLTTDIVPTLVDVLGLSPCLDCTGQSLRNVTGARSREVLVREADSWKSAPVPSGMWIHLKNSVMRKNAAFHHASEQLPFAAFAQQDLVGRFVTDFPVTEDDGVHAELFLARAALDRLTDRGEMGVTRMKGQLVFDVDAYVQVDVAVALHGRIIGTTQTVPYVDKQTWFSLMVSAEQGPDQSPEFATYLIVPADSHEGGVRLVRVTQRLTPFAVAENGYRGRAQ